MEHVGLEAISRGAKKAILCDKSKEAIKVIQKNIKKTKQEEKVELYNLSFDVLIKTKINEKVDIVYIDPPYKTDYAYQAVELLLKENHIHQDSKIIIETDEPKKISEQIQNLDIKIIDERKYGRAYLIFLSKKDEG